MLRILVESGCVKNKANLNSLFQDIVNYCGEGKFEIRQEAMRLFIAIMKPMASKDFITTSIRFLKSPNWRIREEILNLIIINLMKEVDPKLDFEKVVNEISQCITDENPKVRFVAREA